MTEAGGAMDDSQVTPIVVTEGSAPSAPPIRFRLPENDAFLEVTDSDEGKKHELRLKDYLRSSLQMQHLAILCGSGTSIESGLPSMPALWQEALQIEQFDEVRADVGYQGGSNLEEFLSRCDAFIELKGGSDRVAVVRAEAIGVILEQCRKCPRGLEAHADLLKKLIRRRARDSRVKLFTTNYDLCFESAAGELGIIPIDGFSFGSPRRFDPRFFEYDIVRRTPLAEGSAFVPGVFHFYKLHGSVDWKGQDGSIIVDRTVGESEACLIYPARAKFQRSYQQPHLELMARYLATVREPNTCLVVAGFGFNDDHLSGPILAALRSNPHFRLIVVCRDPEAKLDAGAGAWSHLRALSSRADVSFVAASFSRFAELIPDLSALSRADELQAAVVRAVKEGSS
jgi:hypothetical protein